MFIFHVYRREQDRVRASINRENESNESRQQKYVYKLNFRLMQIFMFL